jgi:hypothetical protein
VVVEKLAQIFRERSSVVYRNDYASVTGVSYCHHCKDAMASGKLL